MNILFISETFPDAAHPATGTYNLALCHELARQHSVKIISPRSWIDVVRGRRFQADQSVRDSGLEVLYPTRWYTPGFAQSRYGGQMWWSIRSALRTLTRDWKPDAVLSYWAHPDGECGLRAGQLIGAPSAVIVGGSDVLLLPKDRVRGECVRRVLRESDTVITVSDGLRNACLQLGIPGERVRTIRQGIDPRTFHSGDQAEARSRVGLTLATGEKMAVWVGRMVGLKRVDVLIRTCRILKDGGQRVRFCLLGEGPCRSEWEQLAISEGVADQIQFVGPVGHDRLADWYRAADLTVLCSESEGLPNVLRESVACGTPFVSTDVGSIREIAEPQFSELVPVNEAPALASGIQSVIHGSHAAAAKGFQPRSWVETAHDTQALFEVLIDRKKARGLQPLGITQSPHSHRAH